MLRSGVCEVLLVALVVRVLLVLELFHYWSLGIGVLVVSDFDYRGNCIYDAIPLCP